MSRSLRVARSAEGLRCADLARLPSSLQMLLALIAPHPPRVTPTDFFWSGSWVTPEDQPTGSFTYRVIATDNQGNTQTWEPFKIATSQLTVVAGEPPMAPKAQ